MKFVQYKEDVIWKEGRMCLRGKPFEVEDQYGLSVFSNDPKFELAKENEDEEEVQETAAPEVLGRECYKCHKIIPKGWYMHQKWCKGI